MASETDFDDQDQAEAFDEDVMGDEGLGPSAEMRVFEELPDVYDVTSAVGDADVDEDLTARDADEIEEDELDTLSDDQDEDGVEDDTDEDLPEDDDDFDDEDDLDEVDGVTDPEEDDADLEYEDDVDDASADTTTADYESETELSEEDVEELGYKEEEEQDDVESPDDSDRDLPRKPAEGTSAEAGEQTSKRVDQADLDDLDREERQDALLDEGVAETFPASDPVSVKRIT